MISSFGIAIILNMNIITCDCPNLYDFYDFVICRCLTRELERHFVFRWPSGASMEKRFIAKSLKECMTWSLPLIRICGHVLSFTKCLSEKKHMERRRHNPYHIQLEQAYSVSIKVSHYFGIHLMIWLHRDVYLYISLNLHM